MVKAATEFTIKIPGQPPGDEVIERLKQKHKRVLLAFSCGKDCIAAWLKIRDHFEVIPYHMSFPPGLEFVEESLAYYEQFFGTKILRVVHPSLYRCWKAYVFQSPDTWPVIQASSFREYDYDELRDDICRHLGIPLTTWSATGVRAADSMQRRAAMRRFGPINYRRLVFYPVWDMNKAGLMDILRRSGVKMPVDYQIFGRSHDGIDFRFLYPIKRYFPRDYAKILEFFPMAEVEIKRYEYAQAKKT